MNLALPEGAWGRPGRFDLARHWREGGMAVVAGLFAIYGMVGCAGAFFTLLFAGGMGDSRFPLVWFTIGIKLSEGLAWILLGVSTWRDSPARIRKCVALVLLVTAASSAVSIFRGLTADTHPELWLADRWLSILLAPTCTVLGIGVWQAREWSRLGSVLLGIVHCAISAIVLVVLTVRLVGEDPNIGSVEVFFLIGGGLIAIPLVFGPAVALTIYGSRSSTRSHFAEAREAS